MDRIKQLTLAALVALALAGGLTVGSEAAQVAGSKGDKADFGRESSLAWAVPDAPQIAGSKGEMAGAGRDPSILGATPEEPQVAGSKGDRARGGRESS